MKWRCSSGRPAGHPSCVAEMLTLNITRKLCFVLAVLIGTIDFCDFMPLSMTLTLAGAQGQHKTKPISIIFSHTFHLIEMKFEVNLMQLKRYVLIVLL